MNTITATQLDFESIEKTVCCYCGVGCGVSATVRNNEVITIKGDLEHPANFGRLCVKGSHLHETQKTKDRLLHPRIKGKDVSWGSALDYVANGMQKIIAEHGPDSVAFYLSGQLLTEDYYVANKLMKGFIGTANVDTNSRLCMASAAAAHKRAFGSDVVPGCYEDLEKTDLIILVGSNLAYAHPIVYQRIVAAKKERPHMKVVVLDPRRTATCDIADMHLSLKAGSDAFFFNGLLNYLSASDAIDTDFVSKHCEGFDLALESAQQQVSSLSVVAKECDLELDDVKFVFDLFVNTKKTVTVFSQGVNQSSSGVDKGNAIINCHLATGKIGKKGSAPFSITGQPNAMGGREVGGLANQLAAHMYFDNQEDVDRVERFWQAPNIARKEGLKAVDMFKAVNRGKIKAIWIMATNPVVSMPDADAVKKALEKCDLVIVSECIADTDTALTADVLLPATTWSEKHGMVSNSERRLSLQKGFLKPPGEARHDWQIISALAQKMGFVKAFNYQHPSEIFIEHAALSGLDNRGTRGFDVSGLQNLSQEEYDNFQPVQWPVNENNPRGSSRVFSDGKFFTKNQKAFFVPITARLPSAYPKSHQVVMNTGRIRDQWHTMSRTGIAATLWGHTQEPFVDVHPDDIKRFKLSNGGLVVLKNLGAEYLGRVRSEGGQKPGEIFVPMHWNKKFASSSRADALVNDFVDPNCGQPEFKHCPVDIEPFPIAWQGFLLTRDNTYPDTPYWSKLGVKQGHKFRLADPNKTHDWLFILKDMFNEIEDWIQLQDSTGNFFRACGFVDGKLCVALSLDWGFRTAEESQWLEQQLGQIVDDEQRMFLLGGKLPGAEAQSGAIICSCYQVTEPSIRTAIEQGCQSTAALGEKLKCGTNCGSCVPELSALIDQYNLVLEK